MYDLSLFIGNCYFLGKYEYINVTFSFTVLPMRRDEPMPGKKEYFLMIMDNSLLDPA